MANVLDGLYYSKDHEWVKVDGDTATVGITDFAQHSLGEIVFVELPEVDEEYDMNDTFGVVESVKAASDILIPVSGTVTEVNEDLEDSPELLNEDAFSNWIAKMDLSDTSELDELMDADAYKEFCEE
jgi:glycine cleavage system H protein